MNDKERVQVVDFLGSDRGIYKNVLFLLFDRLSERIEFKLKIQKASIQLFHKESFAVVGFRKSKDYFLMEFYNDSIIDNDLIVKTYMGGDSMIVHTIHLFSNSIIEEQIVNWIINSCKLTMKDKECLSDRNS